MNPTAYTAYCQARGLSWEAVQVIDGIRSARPSRRVGRRAGNVAGRFVSPSMGWTVQSESRTVEWRWIYLMEFSSDAGPSWGQVREYWDQPPPITLRYQSKTQRPIGPLRYTPDFFVLAEQFTGWVECKPEPILRQRAVDQPHRYRRGDDGRWHCPPAEEYAAQVGLAFAVVSTADLDPLLVRNLSWLEEYFRKGGYLPSEEAHRALLSVVERTPGISLAALLATADGVSTDDAYALIVSGAIYADLRRAPLAEPEHVLIFRTRELAQALTIRTRTRADLVCESPRVTTIARGAQITFDGVCWGIVNLGDTHVTLLPLEEDPPNPAGRVAALDLPNDVFMAYLERGAIVGREPPAATMTSDPALERLQAASTQDLALATARWRLIEPYVTGTAPVPRDGPTSARAIYKWLARFREALRCQGDGYLGLLPGHTRGNFTRRYSARSFTLLHDVCQDKYATLAGRRTKASVYTTYLSRCRADGLSDDDIIGKRTFYTYVKTALSGYDVELARRGRRGAYGLKPPVDASAAGGPRHGDRVWELAHLDHAQIDLELVSGQTGQKLGRAWVTMLVDAYTRRILALYLSLLPPSIEACMMIVRLCVRRHGRLPQTLMMDGGPEFESAYFEALLARVQVNKLVRPAEEPRYGAVLERLFGTANTDLIHHLRGTTHEMHSPRQVSRSHQPARQALWTLDTLYLQLSEWAYDVYDTIPHPALGRSPAEAFRASLTVSGSRPHMHITYDAAFELLTLPAPRGRATRLITPQGIKIAHLLYWHALFHDAGVQGQQVSVKIDPFNIGHAYAYVQKHWVECACAAAAHLQGRSLRELMVASAELAKQRTGRSRDDRTTMLRLAQLMESAEQREAHLLQRQRTDETRQVLAMTQAAPAECDQFPAPVSAENGAALPTADTGSDTVSRQRLVILEPCL